MGKSRIHPVIHVSNGLVVTRHDVWGWFKVPETDFFMRSVAENESSIIALRQLLSSLVADNPQDGLDIHLRSVRRRFNTAAWAASLTERSLHNNPPPALGSLVTRGVERLEEMDTLVPENYLGVRLGSRGQSATTTWKAAWKTITRTATNPVMGRDTEVVSEEEMQRWQRQLLNVFAQLRHTEDQTFIASAADLIWLIRKPFYDVHNCPDTDIPQLEKFNADDIVMLTTGVLDVQPTVIEVSNLDAHTGSAAPFYTATACISKFSDTLHWPETTGWADLVRARYPDGEWSIRATILPPALVKKEIKDGMGSIQEEINDAAQSGHDGGRKLQEQAAIMSELEYAMAGSTDAWALINYRVQLRGGSPEEVDNIYGDLRTNLQTANLTLTRPPHDQLDLLLESVPGGPWKPKNAYTRRQSLTVLGGGGLLSSYQVGDRDVLGPYLGRVAAGNQPPVFFDPNRAIALNQGPVSAVSGSPGHGKRLWTETPIATPSGWTTMGDIKVGDQVFDEHGHPCTVTHVTPVELAAKSYKVVFSDGSVIYADGDHRWLTDTRASLNSTRNQAKARRRATYHDQTVIDALTAAIADTDPEDVTTIGDVVRRVPDGPGVTAYEGAARSLEADGVTPQLVYATSNSERLRARLWPTRDLLVRTLERASATYGDQRDKCVVPMVRTTEEIRATLRVHKDQRANHSIPVAGALHLPEADLPIHPYLLGVWLGDGDSRTGKFCGVDHEVAERVRALGYTVTERISSQHANPDYREWNVEGLRGQLRALGITQTTTEEGSQKHIPDIYLRASINQRRELLAGLLDTDGTVAPTGQVQFTSINARLAGQVRELALSLGYRAVIYTKQPNMNGSHLSPTTGEALATAYTVQFTTTDNLFHLTRKSQVLAERTAHFTPSRNDRRYIVEVEPVAPLPMLCITVDSPSHLYLAGDSFIPTHNTFHSLNLAYQAAARGYKTIYIDPKADAVGFANLPDLGRVTLFDLKDGGDGLLDPFRLGVDREDAGVLALEVVKTLLSDWTEARESAVMGVIEDVKNETNPSLWSLSERCLAYPKGEAAYNIGLQLKQLRSAPFGRLLFSEKPVTDRLSATDGLTVVTLLGLETPGAGTPVNEYTYGQRIGVAVMLLLAKYAQGLMLAGDKNAPKALFIDEAWAILGTAAGRTLVNSIARMGRSHNTSLTLISQNVRDFIDAGIANQVSTRFAFGSDDPSEHTHILDFLGVDVNPTNLSILHALATQRFIGHCLMKDSLGRVGLVHVDPYRQDLFAAFDTNPETRAARARAAVRDQAEVSQ